MDTKIREVWSKGLEARDYAAIANRAARRVLPLAEAWGGWRDGDLEKLRACFLAKSDDAIDAQVVGDYAGDQVGQSAAIATDAIYAACDAKAAFASTDSKRSIAALALVAVNYAAAAAAAADLASPGLDLSIGKEDAQDYFLKAVVRDVDIIKDPGGEIVWEGREFADLMLNDERVELWSDGMPQWRKVIQDKVGDLHPK